MQNNSLDVESVFTYSKEVRMKTQHTVVNKDNVVHQPGRGWDSLCVRGGYYTPMPMRREDILVKVEVS